MKKIFFLVGFIAVSCFFLWTKLISITLVLLFFLDSLTICVLPSKIRKLIPSKIYKILRLVYLFLFPVLLSIFFRTFFLDIYYVPSKSMERTLFPGDYVVVNKIGYGVKLPIHLRNIPVVGNLFKPPVNEYNLYQSLKGCKKLNREDVVVFKAVDNSDKFLIKRIIGMPSDTLKIVNGNVFINNKMLLTKDNYSYEYIGNEVRNVTTIKNISEKEFSLISDRERKIFSKNIRTEPNFNYFLFPRNKQDFWTIDNYGSLIIPKKGFSIQLNKENIDMYKTTALKFEDVDLENCTKDFYTFTKNYFFMLGDNRHNSIDSRSFGFVPEDFIQGEMVFSF